MGNTPHYLARGGFGCGAALSGIGKNTLSIACHLHVTLVPVALNPSTNRRRGICGGRSVH